MDTIFQRLAIDVRDAIDAEQLVYDLLRDEFPNDDFPNVSVYTEMDLDLNARLESGQVILFQISGVEQFDRMLWQFTATFTILGADSTRPDRLARRLFRSVKSWPFAAPGDAGSVGRVMSIDAPFRHSDAKEDAGKNVVEYTMSAVLMARDPY